MSPGPDPSPRVAPTRWKVLLVDDEPAVHEVSRLILSDMRFEDREVELLAAASAAHARDLLARHADIALVLLDVVMETDDAGIVLVQHIREHLHNHDVQIVLRTGQPGVAPEADLMRHYEINGYFLKTEITAQRLRSIVIGSLRAYRQTCALRLAQAATFGHGSVRPVVPTSAQRLLATELASLDDATAVRMQAQPEVALASGEVTGIELVPHWMTSIGLLPAGRVIDAAPADDVHARMVRWLLAQAVHWSGVWSSALGRPLAVSIPLVGERLDDHGATLDAVNAAARDARLPRGTLDLLVGEAALLRDVPATCSALAALRQAGVTVTLVDFGARTISLPQLNDVVPERLKLHRLFVRGVAHEPERQALTRSLIALAQTLNIVSIADGIASGADAQFFKWEGCDLGQGDALAPACAPADVPAEVLRGKRAAH